MEDLKYYGQQIAKNREQLKFSQQDVAQIAGLSDTTVRFIERGKATVSIANWIKVASIVGLNFSLHTKRMSDEARKGL
jgi:DNA-binding XRE family transcriptional regulator